jgi:hypothetical protein
LNDGTWAVETKFGTYTFSSIEELLSSSSLDATFRSDVAKALNSYYYDKQLVFNDQVIPVSSLNSVGNGWFKVGSVHLDAGNMVIRTNFPLQTQFAFSDGNTEDKLPKRIVVWDTPVRRLDNGQWVIDLSFGTYTYDNLGQLLADSRLDANFKHEISKTLHVTITKTDLDIALVSADVARNNSPPPPLFFRQIQPGKLLVNIQNASDPFFLNFLESYQEGWKLYVVPTENFGGATPVRDFAGSVELAQGSSPFPDSYDFSPIQSTSVLDDQHFLLNGFANSWYVNLNDLASQHIIAQDANGAYSFTLLLYFEPQTNFVLGVGASIITGTLVCVVLCFLTVRVWKRSKTEKQKTTA